MNFYRIWALRRIELEIENLIFNLIYKNKLKNQVNIFGFPIVKIAKGSTIKVGRRLTLISHSYFSEPGVNHPAVIRLLHSKSFLDIGDDVGISGGSICVFDKITIGNNVLMGANAIIADTDFHPIEPNKRRYNKNNTKSSPIYINDNVFIGMNSIILKGVTIGENSVIGAGSVVVKDVPSNTIAAGCPARFIRSL